MQSQLWYTVSADKAMEGTQSRVEGLAPQEAQRRLAQGANELVQKKGKTMFQMFLDQLKDFMILVLVAAAVISGLMGEIIDACVIMAIIILNAIIGVMQ